MQDREEISRGLAAGASCRAIARALGRPHSPVAREVARNGGRHAYRAESADRAADVRASRPKEAKLERLPQLRRAVEQDLEQEWSPEQISHRLRMDYPDDDQMRVSHEGIYLSLFQPNKPLDRKLGRRLRTGRTIRGPRVAKRSSGLGLTCSRKCEPMALLPLKGTLTSMRQTYREVLAVLACAYPADAEYSREVFARALVLSWILLDTDADAKNFSLVLEPGSHRLAPLYDRSSPIPYLPGGTTRRALEAAIDDTRLSMAVLGSFRVGDVTAETWRTVARDARINSDTLLDWAREACEVIADIVQAQIRALPDADHSEVTERLNRRIRICSSAAARAIR